MARKTGVLELVGILLFAFSWMFLGLFLSLYGMLLLPWLADKAPSLVALSSPLPLALVITFVVALGAQLLGILLLAIPIIRNRVSPLWVSCLLPASAVWSLIGSLIIAPGGPATNLAVNLLSNLGPVLFLTATSYLGWQMRSGCAMSDRTCME